MALASYTPTQIGRMELPCTSFRTTIGILVTGSIIRPRIFISSSIAPPWQDLKHFYHLVERDTTRKFEFNLAQGLQVQPLKPRRHVRREGYWRCSRSRGRLRIFPANPGAVSSS